MFQTLLFIIIFLTGLVIGSFLNCIIYRLAASERRVLPRETERETGGSFLKTRSFCPVCKHQLGLLDLIPVFSFLILRGKCRYCLQKISWQYPIVEILTGLIFLLNFNFFTPLDNFTSNGASFSIFNQFSISNFQFLNIFYYLIISCFLIVIFVYDLKHYIIPDKIIYPAIGITFLYQLFRIWDFGHWDLFRVSDLGFGILPSLFFLVIILFSQGQWMGFGDFKLAILMGLILGFPNILLALFLAFFTGAIIGVGLVISGKKTLKSEVPFGPFLVAGTFIALFWGRVIVEWYMQLLTI